MTTRYHGRVINTRSNRILQVDLDATVARINRATGSPEAPYTKGPDGKFTANIGNYHLSGAYGGVALHRMVSEGGGVQDVFGAGHMPKRELYHRMHAFLQGLEVGKDQAKE